MKFSTLRDSFPLLLIATLIYFFGSLYWGFFKYPHEDVLILYRYVEILAQSGVISFNLNEFPIEGATDFFWLIVLTFFFKLGIDPFLTSQILNAISLFGILYFLHKFYFKDFNPIYQFSLIFVFLNIGPIVGASVLGFSALSFCFIMLLVYHFSIQGKLFIWAIFSIIFCLLRPEAFIFFLPTILISYQTSLDKFEFIKYFLLISFFGIIYLIFRYFYFNELLPLPIVVKGIGGETSIIRYFARISELFTTFFIPLCLTILCYVFLHWKEFFSLSNRYFIFIVLIIPTLLIYIFLLSTGHASQNIFFRYFAPVYFLTFLIASYSLKKLYKNRIIFNCLFFLIIVGSLDHSNLLNRISGIEAKRISNPTTKIVTYFNEEINPLTNIAFSIMNSEEDYTIMLTEAGNIPFFSKKRVIDIAGLNYPLFSKRPVSCKDFKDFNADLVEIDIGPIDQFNFQKLVDDDTYPQCGVIEKNKLYSDNEKSE